MISAAPNDYRPSTNALQLKKFRKKYANVDVSKLVKTEYLPTNYSHAAPASSSCITVAAELAVAHCELVQQ